MEGAEGRRQSLQAGCVLLTKIRIILNVLRNPCAEATQFCAAASDSQHRIGVSPARTVSRAQKHPQPQIQRRIGGGVGQCALQFGVGVYGAGRHAVAFGQGFPFHARAIQLGQRQRLRAELGNAEATQLVLQDRVTVVGGDQDDHRNHVGEQRATRQRHHPRGHLGGETLRGDVCGVTPDQRRGKELEVGDQAIMGADMDVEWARNIDKPKNGFDVTYHTEDAAKAAALQALTALTPVPGRMQQIVKPGQPLVAVDYAHTPDAVETALKALRPHVLGRIVIVFGAASTNTALSRRSRSFG
mgnify:CR=1 FL=1